jgi:hypothetical protein
LPLGAFHFVAAEGLDEPRPELLQLIAVFIGPLAERLMG